MGVRLLPPGRGLRFRLTTAFLNLDPRPVYPPRVHFPYGDYGLHARFRYAAQAVNILSWRYANMADKAKKYFIRAPVSRCQQLETAWAGRIHQHRRNPRGQH
jgi:hypothetical protein